MLLDGSGRAKVGDFGESTQFDQDEAKGRDGEEAGTVALTMTLVGTPMYCKYSVQQQQNCGAACDSFLFVFLQALRKSFFEMASRRSGRPLRCNIFRTDIGQKGNRGSSLGIAAA